MKQTLLALLYLIASWFERVRKESQYTKDQEERDVSENDPNAWFDDEFGANGRVQSPEADASRTGQTNTDQN